jgi:hypothetical protein
MRSDSSSNEIKASVAPTGMLEKRVKMRRSNLAAYSSRSPDWSIAPHRRTGPGSLLALWNKTTSGVTPEQAYSKVAAVPVPLPGSACVD